MNKLILIPWVMVVPISIMGTLIVDSIFECEVIVGQKWIDVCNEQEERYMMAVPALAIILACLHSALIYYIYPEKKIKHR